MSFVWCLAELMKVELQQGEIPDDHLANLSLLGKVAID